MSPLTTERHTYKMGVIGNCAYMAHIDTAANVTWMCWPQFDSPSLFGGLLDQEGGGHFFIAPVGEAESKQYYLENTNILVTEFTAADGAFRVIDFAPRFRQFERYNKPHMLCRRVELLSGRPKIQIVCRPRGGYAQLGPETHLSSNHIRYVGFEDTVRLYADVPLAYISESKPFVLNRSHYLILTWASRLESAIGPTFEDYFQRTLSYWREWVMHASIGPLYQKEVIRSALVLKLHQFEDTGAIIASGTTSLPESPGSGRNWDYRYCWMRDAYYTLKALNNIGHFEELIHYAGYIQNIALTEGGRYQPVYSISGTGELHEKHLALPGYLKNQPVRVGNQAYEHIQNDVYGQILVALLPLYIDARFLENRKSLPSLEMVHQILDIIERLLDEPDAGLWEFRSREQRHTYTYLFHWAGALAAQKMARFAGDARMLEKGVRLQALASARMEEAFDPKQGVYTQAIESSNLDASLLQLITMNYLNHDSEKARAHLKAVERELLAEDCLFYRYIHADDFGKPKSTFLICAYWYVEALACVGRIDDAIRVFEGLLRYQNHLGLMSEDVEAGSGSQWGNFPQTYSHVGLMNAAFRIARKINAPDFLV